MLRCRIVQKGTFEMTPETGVTDNRPTCSLLESMGGNMLESWNVMIDIDHPVKKRSDIQKALASIGVRPGQIKVVILTHLHPDHIGHKDLFSDALFIFHRDEKLSFHFKENNTFQLDGDVLYELSGDGWPQYVESVPDLRHLENCVYIRHCPGHTRGSIVIFACIEGLVYAFVGGTFLNKSYYENWQPPGMSWQQERIYDHMTFIRDNADIIVPGHGAPFKV